jgi:HEAT repeat protein
MAVAFAAVIAFAPHVLAVDEATRKLVGSSDWEKRWDAVEPLSNDGSPEAVRLIARLLADANVQVRDHATWGCGLLKSDEAVSILSAGMPRVPPVARAAFADGLARTGRPAALLALADASRTDADANVRAAAIEGMESFRRDPRAAVACAEATRDRDPVVRAAALWAASKLDRNPCRVAVVSAFTDADEGVRCASLAAMWSTDARQHLEAAAADASWRVRVQCADTAVWIRTEEAVDALVRLLRDPHDRVASSAARGLRLVSGKDFARDADLWEAWWKQNRAAWQPPKGDLTDPRTSAGPGTRAQFMGTEVEGECTAFVLDFSGSMGVYVAAGEMRADRVRKELATTLAALPDGHRVNVFLVSDRVRAFAPRAPALGPKVRADVAAFVKRQVPDGDTNLIGGVLDALDDDAVDSIHLLTDGVPTTGEVTASRRFWDRVARRNRLRKVAIHTVGMAVTDDSDRAFLAGLASRNGGRSVFR